MGFTFKVLLHVVGVVCLLKTLPTDAEEQESISGFAALPCIWKCPIIVDNCLLKGGEKNVCEKVSQQCSALCDEGEAKAKRSKSKR